VPARSATYGLSQKKAGYKIAGAWKETASGARDDRAERKEVLALA
jgi:putative DNA-invertase from lambdoid prophage Rac